VTPRIPAYNRTDVPQKVGDTWIPAKVQLEVPLPDAFALRTSPDLHFDWAAAEGGFAPNFAEGELAGLTYVSPLSVFDGYGLVGVVTAREFLKRGVDLDLYQCGWLVEQDLDHDLRGLLRRPKRYYRTALVHGEPDSAIPTIPAAQIVSHAMWESDRLPDTWAPLLNTLPLAIVPSRAMVGVYRDSGVTCPITVVPDAIDVDFWAKRPAKPADDAPFTIVSWSRMTSRKMPLEMVYAFQLAFPRDRYPDVRFELKTNGGNFGAGRNVIPGNLDPRVTIHDGAWPLERLRDWVATAHLGFFLSRAEGMFNPPLQAMALGVPVVCADHSGPADFMEERFGYPVQLDPHEPLVPSPLGPGMRWWNPDLEHAVAQLRAAHDDYAEAKRRARRAKAMIPARYRVEIVVNKLIAALKEIA
jgi:glycosyltransferase involved in cell wall biosynthesis